MAGNLWNRIVVVTRSDERGDRQPAVQKAIALRPPALGNAMASRPFDDLLDDIGIVGPTN